MTTCVLYSDEDFEPITVLDVPQWALDKLGNGGVVQFVPQMPTMAYAREAELRNITFPVVQVFAERLWRRNRETLLLFTRNDEWALRLRREPLPGQRGDMQERMRDSFVRGFITALEAMR